MTLTWIIVTIVVIGVIIWLLTKKKGPGAPTTPQGPSTPPEPPAM